MNTQADDDEPLAPVVDLLRGRRSAGDRSDSVGSDPVDSDPLDSDPRDADPVDALLRDFGRATRPAGSDDELLATLSSALPNPPILLRVGIALLATAQLIVVLPWLVDIDPFGLLGDSTGSHLARDGALGLAVAVAAFLTAWRPRWAVPSFLIASVVLIAQTTAGLIDSADSTGANELIHLPSVALACLIGLSSIRLGDLRPRQRASN